MASPHRFFPSHVLAIAGAGVLLWLAGCSDQTVAPQVDGILLAPGGGGPPPKVNEAIPPSAEQDTTLDVRVLGSNFDDGSTVEFTIEGAAQAEVRTNSITFVSESELVSNITIDIDAVVDLYDVEVTTTRGKKGIGADKFSVVEKGGGGSKGKPQEITLWEYWVTPTVDGRSEIHIVFQGEVDLVNANVSHDYFHNGFRGYEGNLHFEYGHTPPQSIAPDPELLADGFSHADLIWDGKRDLDTGLKFRDQLTTNVDGQGADPFVFGLGYAIGSTGTLGIRPEGVVIDGVTGSVSQHVDGGLAGHDPATVTSYAVFQGIASGNEAFVTDLSMATTPTCTLETVSVGKGKDRSRVTQQRVTVQAHAEIGSDVGPPSAWLEFHLVVDEERLPRSTITTYDGVADLELNEVVEAATSSVSVGVLLDYVYPQGATPDLVYNPDRNVPMTLWTEQTALLQETWPVVSTATVTVPCT